MTNNTNNTVMRHDFDGGKYTVINDGGNLTALRHGEPWGRDFTGDNLVYHMLIEVDALKRDRIRLQQALKALGAPTEEAEPERVQITAEMVRTLRDATDAPLMQAKECLTHTGGDMDLAKRLLLMPFSMYRAEINALIADAANQRLARSYVSEVNGSNEDAGHKPKPKI